jgi:hypothetical protein
MRRRGTKVLYRFLDNIVKNMFVVEPEVFLHYIKTKELQMLEIRW